MTYEPDPDPRYVRTDEPVDDRVLQPVAAPTAVVTAPAVERVVVAQPAAVHQRVATTYGQRFAFDSLIVGIVGLALTIVGLIALTRAGIKGPMDQPVVKVLGYTHTATLGAIEAGIGICLLICAAATARAAAVFFGLVLGVAGIVGAAQTSSFRRTLALQSGLAWWAVIAAAIVVLVSLLVPRMITSSTRVASY
jgi:uncharacterized membrane protein HdeD (DUF308 family)